MAMVVDQAKVGKRGFPRHWAALGINPPTTPGSVFDLTGVGLSTPPTKEQLLAYAATARWKKEVSGIIVAGDAVATDRDSQARYLTEFVAMSAGLRADPSLWKFADGTFKMLSNAQMGIIINAVHTHVTDAFALEQRASQDIIAGTLTTTDAIDALFA